MNVVIVRNLPSRDSSSKRMMKASSSSLSISTLSRTSLSLVFTLHHISSGSLANHTQKRSVDSFGSVFVAKKLLLRYTLKGIGHDVSDKKFFMNHFPFDPEHCSFTFFDFLKTYKDIVVDKRSKQ
jgi:hypothetical protein